jgi:hypothetical protein
LAAGAPQRLLEKGGGGERKAVAPEPGDDLDAERQPAGVRQAGDIDARGAEQGPQPVEGRLAVEPRPAGAAPGADGVRITVPSASRSAKARRARRVVRRASS